MSNFDITELNVMLAGEKPNRIIDGDWIAVDGGLNYLLDNNIVPLLVYGDFDSCDKTVENLKFVKKYSQDITDFEFTLLSIVDMFPFVKTINVYGATGNRLDHFLANLLLLKNEKIKNSGITLNIIDNKNFIYLSKVGRNSINFKKNYKYISFIPIENNTIVSIQNAKYSVSGYLLSTDKANATSNEFINEKSILFITNKECLIIYSRD